MAVKVTARFSSPAQSFTPPLPSPISLKPPPISPVPATRRMASLLHPICCGVAFLRTCAPRTPRLALREERSHNDHKRFRGSPLPQYRTPLGPKPSAVRVLPATAAGPISRHAELAPPSEHGALPHRSSLGSCCPHGHVSGGTLRSRVTSFGSLSDACSTLPRSLKPD